MNCKAKEARGRWRDKSPEMTGRSRQQIFVYTFECVSGAVLRGIFIHYGPGLCCQALLEAEKGEWVVTQLYGLFHVALLFMRLLYFAFMKYIFMIMLNKFFAFRFLALRPLFRLLHSCSNLQTIAAFYSLCGICLCRFFCCLLKKGSKGFSNGDDNDDKMLLRKAETVALLVVDGKDEGKRKIRASRGLLV